MPEIDTLVGMGVYSTDTMGTGGSIKKNREDFAVHERLSDKTLSKISNDGQYPIFELKKNGIDTNHALLEVQKKTGVRLKSLGLKDSRAVTTQYVCAISKTSRIREYTANRFTLCPIGFSQRPLTAKDMIGNHFTIRVDNPDADVSDFNEYEKIMNYFGYQRFGSARPVSHRIGKCILQADYAGALHALLAETSKYDSKDRTQIREDLSDASKFSSVIDRIPTNMDMEKAAVLDIINGGDNESAIRTISSKMRKFFVQAFQSYIFNKTITLAIQAGEDFSQAAEKDVCFDTQGSLSKAIVGEKMQRIAVPLVGHSYYTKTRFNPYIKNILEDEEVSIKDFFLSHMQEASIEGGFRGALLSCTECTAQNDTVEFTLSRGSYATVVLREIIKPNDPILAGFA